MKKFFSFVLLAVGLMTNVRATPFVSQENFESYASDAFVTDQQPPWYTSDQWLNNGIITDTPNGQAGWLGGLYSGPTPPLPVALDYRFNPQDNNQFTFRWVQNIANPNPDDSIRDTFGWAVKDTQGNQLLSLKMANEANAKDGQNYDTAVYGYQGSWTGTELGPLSGQTELGLLNRGEYTVFEIAVDTLSHTWSASFAAGSNVNASMEYTFIAGAALLNTGYAVGGLSALWNLEDTSSTSVGYLDNGSPVTLYTGAGGNTMIMDNIRVTATAIPEPSSLVLLGVGSVMLLGIRKSRRA